MSNTEHGLDARVLCSRCEGSLTEVDFEYGFCTQCKTPTEKTKENAMAKFKRQTIGVAINPNDPAERVQVPALVLGQLAVHGVLGGADGYTPSNSYFVVTHIPSGYKMAEGYKQRNCRKLVEQLMTLDVDWNFTAQKPSQSWFDYAQPIIRAFNSDTSN